MTCDLGFFDVWATSPLGGASALLHWTPYIELNDGMKSHSAGVPLSARSPCLSVYLSGSLCLPVCHLAMERNPTPWWAGLIHLQRMQRLPLHLSGSLLLPVSPEISRVTNNSSARRVITLTHTSTTRPLDSQPRGRSGQRDPEALDSGASLS